jgi:hypothetical protein
MQTLPTCSLCTSSPLYFISRSLTLQDVLYLDRFFNKFCAKMLGVGSIFLHAVYKEHLLNAVYTLQEASSPFCLQSTEYLHTAVCLKYHLSTLMIFYMLSTESIFCVHGSSSTCCLQLPACLHAVYRKRILCTWSIFYMLSTQLPACLRGGALVLDTELYIHTLMRCVHTGRQNYIGI